MNLKALITCCILLISICLNAQNFKLEFEPQGKVIEFHFDSLIIFTDTNSLLNVYLNKSKNSNQVYFQRVRNLVLRRIQESKNDTTVFTGNIILFNDSIGNKDEWYLKWAFLELIKKKRLKIIDKHGQLVRKITIKKVGTKKKGLVRIHYINKETNELIFYKTIYREFYTPRF